MTTDYSRGLDAKATASSTTVSPVGNAAEPKASEKRDQKVAPNVMEIDSPDDLNWGGSKVVLSADFLYSEKIKDIKRSLKPLQDGYREEKASSASTKEKIDPSMVIRFDSLTALIATTNSQTSRQISELAAAFVELQKRPQCVCSRYINHSASDQEVCGPRLSDLDSERTRS